MLRLWKIDASWLMAESAGCFVAQSQPRSGPEQQLKLRNYRTVTGIATDDRRSKT